MRLSVSLYDTIAEVPAADWQAVCSAGDTFMDLAFLAAVEESLAAPNRCYFAIVRDGNSQPQGAAVFCLYRLDGVLLANGPLRKFTQLVRRLWKGYMWV